jgi:serine/threonine protein kinase
MPLKPPDADSPAPERGRPFGRFRLLDKVGQGDVAEVFRALVVGVQGFERRVAIKLMRNDVSEGEPGRLFAEEARVSALLDHPSVVQVYEFGAIEGTPYIAMEYLRGKNLAEVMSGLRGLGEPMLPSLAVFIAQELAGALAHAHETEDATGNPLRIVHGNVSPANIMLVREGAVKLLDFGVWPVIDGRAPAEVKRQGKAIPLNAPYLSPEQVLGQPIDERSDLFSLGVVLWEMLTGRLLFAGKSERQTLANVTRAEIKPPSMFAPDIPPSLDELVLAALSRDPARRYRAASLLARDLEEMSLALPSRHGDLMALLDRLGGSPRDTGSHKTLVGDAANPPSRPSKAVVLPTHPLQPVTPPRIPSDRTPTTRMMGDTTLAAILAREPRRRTSLRARLVADPKSLLVITGSLVAGLLITAALLTGRSKPVAHPTETTLPTVTAPSVSRPPPVMAATPPAPPSSPCASPDAGPPCWTGSPDHAAPPPRVTAPRPRRRPSEPARPSLGDHRPNPFK